MTDSLTPEQFIHRWHQSTLNEKSGAHLHFKDLCELLDEVMPTAETGDFYGFEKGVLQTTGKRGWADVWKKGCFAWEYKSPGEDLKAAFLQLQRYAIALENPPLLIVSDLRTIQIYTNFTNTVQRIHTLALSDLLFSEKRQLLKWAFSDPEKLRPDLTQTAVTEEFASEFANLAQELREQGVDPKVVAHFLNRVLFCLFAQDIGLLENHLMTTILKRAVDKPERFVPVLQGLFQVMQTGGAYGAEEIVWFNGSLFDNDTVLPLKKHQIQKLYELAQKDWKDISPSIFGTLFERGLDPDKRSQLGAHYTDPQSILDIVQPVVIEPLMQQWQTVKAVLVEKLAQRKTPPDFSPGLNLDEDIREPYLQFIQQLKQLRILDPACGSGNFLYLTIQALKDFEHQIAVEVEALGLKAEISVLTPEVLRGIEVNPYAAELARVTVWIGYLQWRLKHGYKLSTNPVLKDLQHIECRDALLDETGQEAIWQPVDFIIGNPPFLGNKKMISVLGESYVSQLRTMFREKLSGGVDLVCYWFEKARDLLAQGKIRAAGFVATNSIRGGANREVLEKINAVGEIFNAWDDREWVNEGAAVRVSLVCFGTGKYSEKYLNNQPVINIYADLTAPSESQHRVDLTCAKPLTENMKVSFIGTQKNGAFDIPGDLAREWLKVGFNPHGKPNSDVLRPWANGRDITSRYSDTWIIDFGTNMSEDQASLYEKPFEYTVKQIKPLRVGKREERANEKWWILQRSRPEMRLAVKHLSRFIATPMTAKHRLFVWLPKIQLPENLVVVIAREDDTTFGILHSRFHEIWSLRLGTSLEDRPRYTPTTTFETFPFPASLTPNRAASDYFDNLHAQAIAEAAKRLHELRENWLNPPSLIRRVPEVVAGYPERIVPVDAEAEKLLKKRTLTNLYNEKPQWLVKAHQVLDNAVAAAYGFENNLSDDEILARLLALNLQRSESV
jgi:type II restriction/modification system DNA methylase subunit YeeA